MLLAVVKQISFFVTEYCTSLPQRQNFPQMDRLIKDMTDLSAYLLEVCSYGSIGSKPVGSVVTSMDKVCRELVRRTTHK